MARDTGRSSVERGDVPAGNGGRVTVPIYRNPDGSDASIDPINQIYSGMLKRSARQDGRFTPEFDNLDDVEG
jgi:hypothetical protein